MASLQVLRAIAALLVVGFHLQAAMVSEGHPNSIWRVFQFGEAGVDLFFVLSGFIIYFASQRQAGGDAWTFIKGRFLRVYPVFWAVLFAYVIVYFVGAKVLGDVSLSPDWMSVLRSALLIPYPGHVPIVAWTLSLEILFYGIFALTFFRGGTKMLLAGMSIWSICALSYTYGLSFRTPWLAFVLNSVVLEFFYGVILGVVFVHFGTRFWRIALGVGLFLLTLNMTGIGHNWPVGREVTTGLPAMLIVYGLLGVKRRFPQWVLLLGDGSYVLYLVHLLVFLVVGKTYEIVTGTSPYLNIWSVALLAVAAIVLSCAAHVLGERPYQKWYKSRLIRRRDI
ncbi:acyltransferase family protein [Aestuariibius sp. HNIBRBA575]|uniref:acyltransferase family protein n=1 Tax=Aestuariibius sp. HNIBRBA575 TaxID=3233343 RepID=UPI0034A5A25D